ncbi:PKD domain protein [Verrucomicrobiia bacterium DG1235]|nr:PKD domain protein [Verrucomicrobiae bacterium DG1235]
MKQSTKTTLAAAFLILAAFFGAALFRTPESPSNETASSTPISATELTPRIQAQTEQLLEKAEQEQTDRAELVELAQIRREYMRRLIEEAPQKALEQAISYADYHSLPPEVQALTETPFTQTVDYSLAVVCDHDPATPQYQHSIRYEDGTRSTISPTPVSRLSISKSGLPVQGIRLDDTSVVRPETFQTIDAENLNWATSNLPLANFDPTRDFLTNQPIAGDPIHAISGGFLFRFANEENLSQLATQLAALDARPGLSIGSPALIETIRQEAAPFSQNNFFAIQAAAVTPPTDEVRDYLIIRVEFSDVTGTPFTQPELETVVDTLVAPKLAEFSYNKTTIDVTVSSSAYTLAEVGSYDNVFTIYDEAVAAYIADGNSNPETQYDHISINFPRLGLPWEGFATIGGQEQWLNGRVRPSTILHELGHNYGLSHASYWQYDATNSASTDPVDITGTSEDYGDPFDVMGDGDIANGHFHIAAKQYLGWIDNSNWQTLETPADSGTYRIYRFDSADATGLQGLRIAKSETSDYYWVGYRKRYSGIPTLASGAYLIWENRTSLPDTPANNNNRCWLIDTTIDSPDGKVDAGLALGHTYSDPDSNLHITPLATGQDSTGDYLDVRVNIGAFTGNQSPTGTLTASESGEARTPTSFSFSGSDPDNDQLSYYWNFGDRTVETNSNSIEHLFPHGGDFTLKLTVSDTKGGTYTEQANIVVSDPTKELTSRVSNTTADLNTLAANESFVVAGGAGGTFLRSADGATWTNQSLNGFVQNVRIADIIWSGTEFLAVGSDFDSQLNDWVGIHFSSPEGAIWTPIYRTNSTAGTWGFTSIATNPENDTVVIVRNDARLQVKDSDDTWHEVDLGLNGVAWLSVQNPATILWTGSSFLLGGYDQSQPGVQNRLVLFQSSDGLNWTNIATTSGFTSDKGMKELTLLNGQLLGSGFKTRLAYSADDGLSWSSNRKGEIYRADMYAYGNGVYSVHGVIDNPVPDGQPETGEEDTPQDFISTDAQNWWPTGAPQASYNDRIFFADTFISIGAAGLIHQSNPFILADNSPFNAWIVGFTTDVASQGTRDNPDNDWAPNFLEYALGSDPTDFASVPAAPSLRYTEDGRITVAISRLAITDVDLTLEISTDLETWTATTTTATVDTELLLELTTAQSYADAEKLFIRIKASQ